MNENEAQLHYPLAEQLPAIGQWLPVTEEIYWLRMPLPFALDHINLWLLREEDGWCAVDCGIDSAATRAAWEHIFAQLPAPARLTRVISTHCHPDHVGLAHWLCEKFQVSLSMSAGEYAFARMMSASMPGLDNGNLVAHFQRHGLSDADAQQMQARRNHYPSLVPDVPQAFIRLQQGQDVQIGKNIWRVMVGFGHAPEHVSLYCTSLGILISGDMILPRISTNISVFALEPEANPLQLYLNSLEVFAVLAEDTLVLPSHGKPFHGFHTRIAQLQHHHALRLNEVKSACASAQSAADIVPLMFRRTLDVHQLSFAMGEALAHLHQLWYNKIVAREIGSDGIFRFKLV